MATKQIFEVARSFKATEPRPGDSHMADRRYYWRWPTWPARGSTVRRDDYLIDIRLRKPPTP